MDIKKEDKTDCMENTSSDSSKVKYVVDSIDSLTFEAAIIEQMGFQDKIRRSWKWNSQKARLIVQGLSQQKSIHYKETFALVNYHYSSRSFFRHYLLS